MRLRSGLRYSKEASFMIFPEHIGHENGRIQGRSHVLVGSVECLERSEWPKHRKEVGQSWLDRDLSNTGVEDGCIEHEEPSMNSGIGSSMQLNACFVDGDCLHPQSFTAGPYSHLCMK